MNTKYLNATEETIYNGLIVGKIKVYELNPDISMHRKAVLKYVKDKPSILKTFNNEDELKFLKYIIENNKSYFIYLNPDQYDEYLSNIYLYDRISKSENLPSNFLSKNYSKLTVLNLDYETCDGEEINYYDYDLETATFLYSKLNVAFKVVDTIKFFKYIDVAIENLGYYSIKQKLTDLIIKVFQKNVIKLVNEDKLGIYKLNAMHAEIEGLIINDINNELKVNGVIAEKINIRKLSVSDVTSKLIEKQDLEILSVKKKKKAEAEYEKLALENYAKKAEIHTANPNYEVGLTEAEKDLALDRYIKKVKFENGLTEEIPEEIELKNRNENVDTSLQKASDKEVEIKYTNHCFWLFALAFVTFIVMIASNFAVGGILICLGLMVAFIGLGVVVNILHKEKIAKVNALNDNDEFIDVNVDKMGVNDNEWF